jgi:ubiquitin carboxyl-terminal hydrolase 34
MITQVAKEVETIGNSGGADHLDFFQKARRLRNDHFSGDASASLFSQHVLTLVPNWAPTLLVYPDDAVRSDTIRLLAHLVFNDDLRGNDDEELVDKVNGIAKNLCKVCLRKIQENYVLPGKPVNIKIVHEIIRVVDHCIEGGYFHVDDDSDRLVVAESQSRSPFKDNKCTLA